MSQRKVKFYAYSLKTPMLDGDGFEDFIFYKKMISEFFLRLASRPKKEKVINIETTSKKEHIELGEVWQEEERFLNGYFITYTYGDVDEYADKDSGEIEFVTTPNQGKLNKVYFNIDLNTGLFLVQKDNEKVFKKDTVPSYFAEKRQIIDDVVDNFNAGQSKYTITAQTRTILMTDVLFPDFLEEIKNFERINMIYVYHDLNSGNVDNRIVKLEKSANDRGLNDFNELTLMYKNTNSGKGVSGAIEYITSIDDELDIGVEGKLWGELKTIKKSLDRGKRAFRRDIEFNNSGIMSFSQLLESMEEVSRKEGLIDDLNEVGQNYLEKYN
ncbi:hypothetical protein [Listeria rustica]|uniref:Uncharacterized protein n=1 Tax=Listeria rustica TaxID=2713503 RepID=A0A7W1YFC8_9LIST|nr:hypothetical protein [Listeria rustica]MBA3925575.1 hypothetical protein [Listeria rustica]